MVGVVYLNFSDNYGYYNCNNTSTNKGGVIASGCQHLKHIYLLAHEGGNSYARTFIFHVHGKVDLVFLNCYEF